LSHDWIADGNFLQLLDDEDGRVAAAVKAAGCPDCGGRLDQADYPRKPRGGDVAAAGERIERRRSLCCARTGCRHRRTPPSLVFLGRRVYLAIAVVVAAWRSATTGSPPRRTVGRWQVWFAALRDTPWWTVHRARLWPPVATVERLPIAIIERLLPSHPIGEALVATIRLLTARPKGG
jgi:hypothetical protein